MPEIHTIEVAGIKRELPLVEVAPGVRIALLNILGDIEFVAACAQELAKKLKGVEYDVLVTAEAKSIPLIHVLASLVEKDYLVLRKSFKPYMGEAISAETVSITTGLPQTLYLDEKDLALIKGKQVVLLDDVISTGSTQKGMRAVMDKAGAHVTAEAAIFTEGDPAQWTHILALGHLPLFLDE